MSLHRPTLGRMICTVFVSFVAGTCLASAVTVPMYLPAVEPDASRVDISVDGKTQVTTLIPSIQSELKSYILNRGNPIAAVLMADAQTGEILAMVQGENPKKWGGQTHTALHSHFPAASLFKTVVAAAAFELTGLDATEFSGLQGGCQNVRPTGVWLDNRVRGRQRRISMHRAYGQSCNGYFAQVAVNYVGLTALQAFAERFGWSTRAQKADFTLDPSPMSSPDVQSSSVHAVGRFAAGFGYVGINAVHATWMMMAIANDGIAHPLRLFPAAPTAGLAAKTPPQRVVSAATAGKLREIMTATIQGGTASSAFRRGRQRRLRYKTGGKTGTLTGRAPRGKTTWFSGMMPIENPRVVVSAVVVLEDLWHIKGPDLAAYALVLYEKWRRQQPPATVDTRP